MWLGTGKILEIDTDSNITVLQQLFCIQIDAFQYIPVIYLREKYYRAIYLPTNLRIFDEFRPKIRLVLVRITNSRIRFDSIRFVFEFEQFEYSQIRSEPYSSHYSKFSSSQTGRSEGASFRGSGHISSTDELPRESVSMDRSMPNHFRGLLLTRKTASSFESIT